MSDLQVRKFFYRLRTNSISLANGQVLEDEPRHSKQVKETENISGDEQ